MATITIKPRQLEMEFEEGQDFLRNKKQRQVMQLILLNNLRRGDENISSTSFWSFFNRVIASLYDPNGSQDFVGSEDSDFKKTEALKKLKLNDDQEIDMPLVEYDWLWDAGAFGRGYLETLVWDKEKKILFPEVLNPLAMIYDPQFSNPQRWRYYGKWITRSGIEIDQLIADGVITGIKSHKEISAGIDPELWDYKVRREAAKEGNAVADTSAISEFNDVYQIYEGFTYNKKGKKVLAWADRNFTKVLREDLLEDMELEKPGKNGKQPAWPIVMRELFREPHSSVAISIFDLLEDKHRAKSVLLNLIYIAAKDEATPTFAYDRKAILDEAQLLQRQIKQHIAVNPESGQSVADVITPLRKNSALSGSIQSFVGMLDNEASNAVGTTVIQGDASGAKGKKNATQAAIMQQLSDLAGQLQNKIIGISQKEYCSHWYKRYEAHAKEGDTKIVSISAVSGVTFEVIELDKIITKYPPKIFIKSNKEADFKATIAKREAMQYLPIIQEILVQNPPRPLLNYLKYVFLPMFIKDSATVNSLIPDTIDEMKAQQENETLMKNKTSPIDPSDDDETHIYTHLMAKKTAAVWAHIFAHEQQNAVKMKIKEQQAAKAAQGQQQPQQGQPGQQNPNGQNQPPQKKKGQQGGNQNTDNTKKAPLPNDATAPMKDAMSNVMAGKGQVQV